MSTSASIPLDSNGNELFGNPTRMRQIGTDLAAAHGRLAPQANELSNDLALIEFTDKRYKDACPSVHLSGPDADLANLVIRNRPPEFVAAEFVRSAIKIVAAATEKTAAYAFDVTDYANKLEQGDAHYRDFVANLPHDLTVSYTSTDAFQRAAMKGYADVRKDLAEKDWDTADKSVLDQNHDAALTRFFAGMEKYCAENADKCKTDLTLSDPYAMANALGVGPDGNANGGTGANDGGGSGDDVNFGSLPWFGRQMQDMFGVIPRDAAAIGSWGGHMVADTGDFVWDAGWSLGKFGVNTLWDAGASGVHSSKIVADFIAGKYTTTEFLKELGSQSWHDAGETLGNIPTYFGDASGNMVDWGTSIAGHTWSGVKDIGDGFVDFVNPLD